MAYVISLAPEAKIFQEHLQDELLDDPKKIFLPTSCQLFLKTPSMVIPFQWGRPRLIAGPPNSEKELDLIGLVRWITGGKDGSQCQETDWTGLVEMPFGTDFLSDAAEAAIVGKKGEDIAKSISKTIESNMTDALAKAKEISRNRTMRHIRFVWQNLEKQWQLNKENNLGTFMPSKAERLCQYVLREEIQREKEREKRFMSEIEETMNLGK